MAKSGTGVHRGRKCRKCGGLVTRRRADEFYCQHCGMQPGNRGLSREGLEPTRPKKDTA